MATASAILQVMQPAASAGARGEQQQQQQQQQQLQALQQMMMHQAMVVTPATQVADETKSEGRFDLGGPGQAEVVREAEEEIDSIVDAIHVKVEIVTPAQGNNPAVTTKHIVIGSDLATAAAANDLSQAIRESKSLHMAVRVATGKILKLFPGTSDAYKAVKLQRDATPSAQAPASHLLARVKQALVNIFEPSVRTAESDLDDTMAHIRCRVSGGIESSLSQWNAIILQKDSGLEDAQRQENSEYQKTMVRTWRRTFEILDPKNTNDEYLTEYQFLIMQMGMTEFASITAAQAWMRARVQEMRARGKPKFGMGSQWSHETTELREFQHNYATNLAEMNARLLQALSMQSTPAAKDKRPPRRRGTRGMDRFKDETCRKCNQKGHFERHKICPLHPEHDPSKVGKASGGPDKANMTVLNVDMSAAPAEFEKRILEISQQYASKSGGQAFMMCGESLVTDVALADLEHQEHDEEQHASLMADQEAQAAVRAAGRIPALRLMGNNPDTVELYQRLASVVKRQLHGGDIETVVDTGTTDHFSSVAADFSPKRTPLNPPVRIKTGGGYVYATHKEIRSLTFMAERMTPVTVNTVLVFVPQLSVKRLLQPSKLVADPDKDGQWRGETASRLTIAGWRVPTSRRGVLDTVKVHVRDPVHGAPNVGGLRGNRRADNGGAHMAIDTIGRGIEQLTGILYEALLNSPEKSADPECEAMDALLEERAHSSPPPLVMEAGDAYGLWQSSEGQGLRMPEAVPQCWLGDGPELSIEDDLTARTGGGTGQVRVLLDCPSRLHSALLALKPAGITPAFTVKVNSAHIHSLAGHPGKEAVLELVKQTPHLELTDKLFELCPACAATRPRTQKLINVGPLHHGPTGATPTPTIEGWLQGRRPPEVFHTLSADPVPWNGQYYVVVTDVLSRYVFLAASPCKTVAAILQAVGRCVAYAREIGYNPRELITDKGGEFSGAEYERGIALLGLKPRQVPARDQHSNPVKLYWYPKPTPCVKCD